MKMTFDGYNAKTVTPNDIEKLQEKYGYNESEDLNEFISTIYLERNPNFSYNIDVITSSTAFKDYYDDSFIYDFDEWSCISWFVKDNVFHALCYDEGDFGINQYQLTSADSQVLQDMRAEFGQWEIKI